MNKKWFAFPMLLAAVLGSALWMQQGCTASYPPLAAMHITPVASTTPGCGNVSAPTLIDDFEDGNNQLAANQCRNGYWYTYDDGSNSPNPLTFALAAGGTGASCVSGTSSYAMHVSGGPFTGYGGGLGVNPYASAGPYDASAYSGVEFCGKIGATAGASTSVYFQLVTSTASHGNSIGMTTSWASYSYSFLGLTDTNTITNLQWNVGTGSPIDFWIDNVSFY